MEGLADYRNLARRCGLAALVGSPNLGKTLGVSDARAGGARDGDMTPDGVDAIAWAEYWSQRWFQDRDGSDRLHLEPDLSGGWATHVEAFGILREIAESRAGADQSRGGGVGPWAKRRGLDRAMRAWGLRAVAPRHRHSGLRRVVAVGEVPTPSMLDPIRMVTRAASSSLLVAADPRVYLRLRRRGEEPAAMLLPVEDEWRLLRSTRRKVMRIAQALRSDPPDLLYRGDDIGPEVVERLLPIVTRSLPWALIERAAIERLLRRARPHSVVLASDQHRVGRVTVEAAHTTGVRTIVVQHGLPRIRIGMVPVVADMVAVWSSAAHSWFVEHGTSAKRLVIVGNPRLDEANGADRALARRWTSGELGLDGRIRLLVAVSPDGGAANAELIDAMLAVVEGDSSVGAVVKLHPGQGEWKWVRQRIAKSHARSRIRVLRDMPLERLLGWASSTLLHRTTVGVESLVYGTPIIVLEVEGMTSGASAELAALSPSVASSAADVARHAEALADETERVRYLMERRVALEAIVGPMDGRAAQRIAALAEGQGDV